MERPCRAHAAAAVAPDGGARMATIFSQLARRNNRFVMGIAVLAAIGGFLFGYDTGVISGASLYMERSLHFGSFGESWIVGSLLLGAVAGAAVSGWSADVLSRRWTKFVSGCVYAAAALGSAFAPDLVFLCSARFVLGLAVGTASFVSPMYISEQSPKSLRGGFTALNQVMVTLGILVAYIADFALQGVAGNWRWMVGLGAVPGVALAVGMALVPHTPRWLVEHGRKEEAREVLEHSREPSEVDEELGEIEEVARRQGSFGWRNLVGRRVRPLLIVGVVLAVAQQLIGINTVIYFGSTILKYTGFSTNVSVGRTVYLGIVNWAFAAIAVLLLDKVGRRPLLLTGTAGTILSLVALGFYFHQGAAFQHANPYFALAAIMAYLAFFEISLGPVFWLMIAEIFPLRTRAKAMAAATMANWIFNFLVSYFFLDLTGAVGRDWTFWLYAGFGLCAVTFFFFKVPETRNRSLEQIEREIRGGDEGEEPAAAA